MKYVLTLITVILSLAMLTGASQKTHSPLHVEGDSPSLLSKSVAPPDLDQPEPVLYLELNGACSLNDGPSLVFSRSNEYRQIMGRISGIRTGDYEGAIQISVLGDQNDIIEAGGLGRKPVATFTNDGIRISDIATKSPGPADDATACTLQLKAGHLYLIMPDGSAHKISMEE